MSRGIGFHASLSKYPGMLRRCQSPSLYTQSGCSLLIALRAIAC